MESNARSRLEFGVVKSAIGVMQIVVVTHLQPMQPVTAQPGFAGWRMRGKLGGESPQIRFMTACTLITAGAVNVAKRFVDPMRRDVYVWLVPDGWKFHPAMHALAIESMAGWLRR